ncbi:MAG: murein L,D-transpeptidase catalytic domain family protein [Bacteroidota bacterium]
MDSSKIREAKAFCRQQKLDTMIAFFVDMRIHPGKNRFFVYQFTTNEILHTGLCCHGMGSQSSATTPVFSNEKDSYCTSVGKYKLGARAYSHWGINIHYKMHGLDSTNTNAFSRIVVLHSYQQVPGHEIYPTPLPLGWSQGCPVISNELMTKLDGLLKNRKMPVMLWIYK